ncbi:MAG: DUF3291 domain-containing protein [Bacteroidota bacterium]
MIYQLAQINIARFKLAPDAPQNQEFFDNIDRINALAEASEGFVWRLKDDEEGDPVDPPFEDSHLVVNMSVWETPRHFINYVYRTDHSKIMGQKKLWFEKMEGPHLAIWWIPSGQFPSLQDGKNMLKTLGQEGPSELVFGMKELMRMFKKEGA